MKIVFFSIKSPIVFLGGAEILTLLVAKGLVLRGHSVIIYTAGLPKRFMVDGVTIVQTPLLSFPETFRTSLLPIYSWVLRPLFMAKNDIHQADIVHAIDSDSIILMAGWDELRDKFVVTIQDYNIIWPTTDHNHAFTENGAASAIPFLSGIAENIRKQVKRRALQKIRRAVCVSGFIAHEAAAANRAIATTIISNCVPSAWENRRTRIKKTIDILYVGKIAPYKGIHVLIEALGYVKKPSLRVVIAGDGNQKFYEDVVAHMNMNHSVSFVGTVPHEHIVSYYEKAKIVVSPSIWPEPCGRSIIEAMFIGCTVIATRVGGTPESLIHGTHGLLVPAGSSRLLAKAIQSLMKHSGKRVAMGARAKVYAHRSYRSETIVRKYESLYMLIGGKK